LALFCKNKKNATVVAVNKLRQKKLHSIREWIYISDKKLLEISLSGISLFKEFIGFRKKECGNWVKKIYPFKVWKKQ
jgi:hypothetical protein